MSNTKRLTVALFLSLVSLGQVLLVRADTEEEAEVFALNKHVGKVYISSSRITKGEWDTLGGMVWGDDGMDGTSFSRKGVRVVTTYTPPACPSGTRLVGYVKTIYKDPKGNTVIQQDKLTSTKPESLQQVSYRRGNFEPLMFGEVKWQTKAQCYMFGGGYLVPRERPVILQTPIP